MKLNKASTALRKGESLANAVYLKYSEHTQLLSTHIPGLLEYNRSQTIRNCLAPIRRTVSTKVVLDHLKFYGFSRYID